MDISVTTLNNGPASYLGHKCDNISFHSSTRITPYEDIFGCPPPFIPIYVLESSIIGEVDYQLKDHDKSLALLNAHLADVQIQMIGHYDLGQRDITFLIGDMVYLKVQP